MCIIYDHARYVSLLWQQPELCKSQDKGGKESQQQRGSCYPAGDGDVSDERAVICDG